jgi:beta-aspartyl-dipeptidase (metallo-type)
MFTLIKGAKVFAPHDLGVQDILMAGGKIAAIEEKIEPPKGLSVKEIKAEGMIAAPGVIDLHVHITGGGGEGGPATRVPEIDISHLTQAGVTTVVGVLGLDDFSRNPDTVMIKVLGLRQEGMSAYMMTGSYGFPPATITGSLRRDLALLPPVVGVGELAISDHRSSQPTYEDLAKVAAEVRVGGLMGNKAGLVHLHMGGGKAGMDFLFRLLKNTEIPITQYLPTHVTRTEELFEQALTFASMGGYIDITLTGERPTQEITVAEALARMKDKNISTGCLTFTSDGNGSLPKFDENENYIGMGIGSPSSLLREFKRLVLCEGVEVAELLPCLTLNPARRIKVDGFKGSLEKGKDADLILFDQYWNLDSVWCLGKRMVKGGEPLVKGFCAR